jgi:hypothetical protein
MFDAAAASSGSEEMATEDYKINRLVGHRVIAGEAKYLVRAAASFYCFSQLFSSFFAVFVFGILHILLHLFFLFV